MSTLSRTRRRVGSRAARDRRGDEPDSLIDALTGLARPNLPSPAHALVAYADVARAAR